MPTLGTASNWPKMPATITVSELAASLRLGDGSLPDEPLRGILLRQLGVARDAVTAYARGAPDENLNEAIIRMCGYLYDETPTALNNAPLAQSGAKALLARWHVPEGATTV